MRAPFRSYSREKKTKRKKKRNEDAKDDVEKKIEESDRMRVLTTRGGRKALASSCDVFARKVMHFPP
tara:strand:+ start:167 stop:367 length:201 start_codon:yes stop_codon:yes gene_type:complete